MSINVAAPLADGGDVGLNVVLAGFAVVPPGTEVVGVVVPARRN